MARRRINKPLTILHIFSGDLWAGAEVMIFNLLQQLRDNYGAKIVALSMNEGVLTCKLRKLGIETHVIPENTYSLLGILRNAIVLFRGKHIDAIHSHRYKENLLARMLGTFLGIRLLITTLHGLPEPFVGEKWIGRTIAKVNYFVLRHFFGSIVSVSQDIATRLMGSFRFKAENLCVVHNGINSAHTFEPNGPAAAEHQESKVFHIGTVGRLVPVKGFELFLEVAAEIMQQIQNVRFSILGDGPLRDKLVQRARGLRIEERIEFLMPRRDPVPYYRSLDIYLNTSFHEGIPMSILEAMACGVPAVASKVGGLSEVISHGKEGFLVEGREPKQYATVCVQIIGEKDLRNMLAQNSIARIQKDFSAVSMAEKYHSLYMNMVDASFSGALAGK